MDCDLWQRPQGTKIGLLSCRRVGIAASWTYVSGKVTNRCDMICGVKQPTRKAEDVQPLMRCAFQSASVQIEAVDVNVHSQSSASKARIQQGPPRLPPSGP